MPVSTPSFTESEKYQPIDPTIGQCIAKDTYISGRIILFWPFKSPNEHHIRFAISAKYPSNIASSAYVSTVPTGEGKWKFMINLLPSASSLKSGQTAQEVIKAEYDALLPYLGSEIKISAEGLKIIKINGKELDLEGFGSRRMWTEKRGVWTVFQDTTQSSTTPSWLEADPIISPPSDLPTRTSVQAGPSHFRPISSHLPQQLNLRPTNSPTKRKRTLSPEKRPEAPPKPPVPAIPEKIIELGKGNLAFTRLQSGFKDTAPLRGSSSIGNALASSSASLETAPQASQSGPDPPFTTNTRHETVPLEMPPTSCQRRLSPALGTQDPTERSRPVHVPKTRAEAEAAARIEGQKRVEAQQAQQRATEDAAAVLERDLEVPNVSYTPIKNMRSEAIVNIIGVVVSGGAVNPPKGNRKDPILSVVFTDPSVYKGEGAAAEDLVVGIFRKTVAELPVELVQGTPILFRGVKASKWNEKVKGNIYTGSGSWAYLMDGKIKYSAGGIQLHKAEVDRLTEMDQWWKKTTGESHVPGARTQLGSSPAGAASKMCLLGDTRDFQFFDAVFKILHIHTGGSQMHYELYVTDGSVSPIPLRNFHNVSHPHTPSSAIYCINIKNAPPDHELPCYEIGNTIRMGNIRAKMFKGELEFIWANLITEGQASQGWRQRRPSIIPKDDPRYLAIEKRLSGLKKAMRDGTVPEPSLHKVQDDDGQHIRSRPEVRLPVADNLDSPLTAPKLPNEITPLTIVPSTTTVLPSDVPTATHLLTIFNDSVDHPIKTIDEVLANGSFPNKFRVRARVKSIHTRGLAGKETFVQKHCGHCKRAIMKTMHCESCQDINMKKAAWCYRFLVILEDEHSTIPVLIADYEADRFLPSLPPISSSTNPNDIRKTGIQIAAANKRVVEILQGGAMDSVRPRPWIDWTLQSNIAQTPKGYMPLKGEKGIVVYKACGMTSN